MKIFAGVLVFLGIISSIFGLIPMFVPFPNGDPTNSGPVNLWEVLIYFAYDGKGWSLSIGIMMIVISLIIFNRLKKLR